MNSWEVGTLWAGKGCGRWSEIPVIWGMVLPRTVVRLMHCSTLRGIFHIDYEVNDHPLELCRAQPAQRSTGGKFLE